MPYNPGSPATSPHLSKRPAARPEDADAIARLDVELVRRSLAGESTAFDLLVVRYQRRIAALISRYRLDSATIEDLTQEAFIKAYRGLHQFRGESTFFTWLARIALNTTKTYLTARKARIETVSATSEDGEIDAYASMSAPDSGEDALASRQLAETINAALEELSPDLRQAITLREIEGQTYEQIAKSLKIPLNTVRSRIFRAREAISVKLKPLLEVSRGNRW